MPWLGGSVASRGDLRTAYAQLTHSLRTAYAQLTHSLRIACAYPTHILRIAYASLIFPYNRAQLEGGPTCCLFWVGALTWFGFFCLAFGLNLA
eukprot:5627696-Pyramimonas_sp.AAC.1